MVNLMSMGKRSHANGEKLGSLRNRTATLFQLQGRRPRILITRILPNGSEGAVKSMAAAFADMGFDVDINLSNHPAADVVRIAVENDVHAIGIPCVCSDDEPFVTELLSSLSAHCGRNVLVAAWMSGQWEGFSPSFKSGIADLKIFSPETGYIDSAHRILDHLE